MTETTLQTLQAATPIHSQMQDRSAHKVLIACYGYGGIKASHALRPWHIASYLANLDYRVEFAGSGEYLHSLVAHHYPIHPLTDLASSTINQSVELYGYATYSHACLQQMVLEELELFSTIKPDLIFGDYRRSLSISTKVCRIPLVTITNASWTRYSKITNWSTTVTCKHEHIAPFNKIRGSFGLPEISSIDDALEGDITLLADSEEFSPSVELPANYRYIGPVFWEDSMNGIDDTGKVPSRSTQPSNPLIVIDFGAHFQSQTSNAVRSQLLQTHFPCIEIRHAENVLGPRPIDYLTQNQYSEIDASYMAASLRQASILVTSGNLESLYRAIRYRVPVLGIPQNEEGKWYITRSEALGVAKMLPDSESKAFLPHLLCMLENRDHFCAALDRLETTISRHDAQKEAADVVAEYLRESEIQ